MEIKVKITDELIKKHCSATIYKRGLEYLREGRVHLRKRSDDMISAVVDGTELYNVQIKFSGNEPKDYFCTCPYYETMGSMCKHIVAALKQRQSELLEGAGYTDENDRLAGMLCNEYAEFAEEKTPLYVRFILYADTMPNGDVSYSAAMDPGNGAMNGIENFLDSYLNGREFKLDRHTVYSPNKTYFPNKQRDMIDILAEAYEMRTVQNTMYSKAVYRTPFGEKTAARIFPLLKDIDFTFVFDGMTVSDVQLKNDDPDILIDIEAAEGEIGLSVSERGCALTRDGRWFLYESNIYRTSHEWRRYFMPVYRALKTENRTQIGFKGDNTIRFAADILPNLKGRHGVVMQGVDELIVNEHPEFKVYLDVEGRRISAVVTVSYGNIVLRIPDEKPEGRKIVIRDYRAEREITDSFEHFDLSDGTYYMSDDALIYDFITFELPLLSLNAEIFASDRFNSLKGYDDFEIKASVSYNDKIDLLETELESNLSSEQIIGILNAVKLKRSFYRMEDGRFIDLQNSPQKEDLSLFARLDFSESELRKRKKLVPKYQALYLDALKSVEKEESFKNYIESIRKAEPKIPPGLENVLRSYQCDGVKWLKQLSSLGFGGILADDMGLGKTLQVLAFVHGEKPDKPTLIITPSSLVYNWLNEIERFIPDAAALIIDGTREDRESAIKNISNYEFVITSYPAIRRDIQLYSGTEFAFCFIDEAQHIKNPRTMSAKSVKKISAKNKFALTGTPIENSLTELWSIFDFVMRGYLYGLTEFRQRYDTPVTKEEDKAATADFKARIRPFILRRMKKDVLKELPEKIENTMYADLTPYQKQMYVSYLATAKNETLAALSEGGSGKIRILSLLMRLRQICCHPSLFDEGYRHDSGKLEMLIELTQSAVESGHRLLIFSQFTSMLAIIREKLDETGIKSFYLDGKTPPYERAEIADRFNGGERDVFLISLKAGGTGLNLIGADMVIHYDPWWNPAAVEQASDRAYRIGQTKAVQIIKLAARGTIEEKILKLQEKKRLLADDIIRVNSETFSDLTDDEIVSLFE